MQAQNTKSALIQLAKCASLSMRWFVLCAGPDQDDNAQNIDPAHRAVNGNALGLGRIAFGFGKIIGGGKPHSGRTSGKVSARFPFQRRETV